MASYSLRIPQNLEMLINLRIENEKVDKLTALRQILYLGAENYVLDLYEKGNLSLSKTSEILNKSVYDIIQLVQKRGIKTGATIDEQKISEKIAKNTWKKK